MSVNTKYYIICCCECVQCIAGNLKNCKQLHDDFV